VVGQPTHDRERGLRLEELAGRFAKELLIFAQFEIHYVPSSFYY
jgi:hypothetical protein